MTTENTQYAHQPVMLEEVLDMWFNHLKQPYGHSIIVIVLKKGF